MKKVIAILLLAIQLFSVVGYQLFHRYFEYKSDQFYESQTRKGLYNINDLTEIKIPAKLPGLTNRAAYQNVLGLIQFENCSYNYVKMKVTRNAIYLMCIPNYTSTKLTYQNIINAKKVKDISVPKREHIPYAKLTLQVNTYLQLVKFSFDSPVKFLSETVLHSAQKLVYHHADIPEKPPRFSC